MAWRAVLSLSNLDPSMARPLRVEFAGSACPVMARGNLGEPVFRHDQEPSGWIPQSLERFLIPG